MGRIVEKFWETSENFIDYPGKLRYPKRIFGAKLD